MFCRYCGKEIADGSSFCKFCGKRLADEAGTVAAESAVSPQEKEEKKDAAPAGGLSEPTPKKAEKSELLHKGGRISVGGTIFVAIFWTFFSAFVVAFAAGLTFIILPALRDDGMWMKPEGMVLRFLTFVAWVLVLVVFLKTVALVLTRSTSYIDVYEDRIEGVSGSNRAPVPIMRRFVFSRDDILDVKREHAGLYLFVKTGAKHFVLTKNAESAARVYEILMRSSHHIDD